jgi:cyclomaltodextrinase
MLDLANERMVYEVTQAGERLVVALSVAGTEVTALVPDVRCCLAGTAAITAEAGAATRLTLPPHGWAILEGG